MILLASDLLTFARNCRSIVANPASPAEMARYAADARAYVQQVASAIVATDESNERVLSAFEDAEMASYTLTTVAA